MQVAQVGEGRLGCTGDVADLHQVLQAAVHILPVLDLHGVIQQRGDHVHVAEHARVFEMLGEELQAAPVAQDEGERAAVRDGALRARRDEVQHALPAVLRHERPQRRHVRAGEAHLPQQLHRDVPALPRQRDVHEVAARDGREGHAVHELLLPFLAGVPQQHRARLRDGDLLRRRRHAGAADGRADRLAVALVERAPEHAPLDLLRRLPLQNGGEPHLFVEALLHVIDADPGRVHDRLQQVKRVRRWRMVRMPLVDFERPKPVPGLQRRVERFGQRGRLPHAITSPPFAEHVCVPHLQRRMCRVSQ
ncbi:hypothetical protein STCU_06868 [Strigomonas culicis]|uniref:Uncharacterized protein n=1 Tax=Strigomonas culicis TaxID=28005 RepID=S9VP14_9TRYP|nr:hypothetical protein STCU_06868 [Strigomonas culicis]|eukprot:EPY25050.1 hypothetical protein STCU_06868 [Strigomonas culicis]